MLFPCLHEQMVFRVSPRRCVIQTNEDKLCSWCSDQLSYCDAYAIFLCLLRRNDNLRPHDDFRGIVFHLSRAILPVNRSRPKSARCFRRDSNACDNPQSWHPPFSFVFLAFVTNRKRGVKVRSINYDTRIFDFFFARKIYLIMIRGYIFNFREARFLFSFCGW